MRFCALHLLADALLWLSATAAPVPREKPVGASDLVGVWRYDWGGTPGVMHLRDDGSYLAIHGEGRQQYAGVWWMDRGRVVIVEFLTDCDGLQRGCPIRHEFGVTRSPGGYTLARNVTVVLTRGE